MKMRTKKLAALFAAATLAVSAFAGCGSNGGSDAGKTDEGTASAASETAKASEAAGDVDYTQGDSFEIKASTVLTEASSGGRALQMMKDELEEKTDGRITMELYFNGVLADWNTEFEMVCNGEIQLATANPLSYETQITELSTLDEYYMFDDFEHVNRFFEGEGGQYLHDAWNKVGVQGLTIFGLGFRELSNGKKEIKTIEDMAGLTIRGYSTIQIDAWKAAGATPTSVDWNELFVSMQQGLLDGQESALSTINDYSFYEVQKYITMTDHVFTMDWLIANQDWLEGLSDTDRQLLDEVVADVYEWQKATYQAEDQELLETFQNDYGMTITYLDDDVKAELKEKMGPVSIASIKEMAGEDVYNTVHDYVEACR